MAKKDGKKRKGAPPHLPASGGDGAPGDDATARKRIALLRHKLTRAMDDPVTRTQIVAAIRSMMAGDGKS